MKGPLLRAALFCAAIMLLFWVAFVQGGGRDSVPVPHASETARGAARAPRPKERKLTKSGGEAYEVHTRLTEVLDTAKVTSPHLRSALGFLGTHWRKFPLPWTPLKEERSAMAWDIALRTSSMELQWSVPTTKGSWTPSARVWNMNEGSFDQRESVFAPTPSTYSFHLAIPRGAKLTFAHGLVSPFPLPVVFSVWVEEEGHETSVCSFRVQQGISKQWSEESCDLAGYEGKTVDLLLRTAEEHVKGGEIPWAPPPPEGDEKKERVAPMALALFGNPVLLAKEERTLPYNVLFVVIDALRPDVLASFHDDEDDARARSAKDPPLDARLPKIAGITPEIDTLSETGVRFTHAYSGGAWTRPGTLSMLSGIHSSELGIDTLSWVVSAESAKNYYAASPPLLPLLFRENHALAHAIVNNFFMMGHAAVGIDMGFERTLDHRYRTKDTKEITDSTRAWLKRNKDHRFFLFVNYNSPHDPYDPPDECRKRVPRPPEGPADKMVRAYMAEACKDDRAVGDLVRTLAELGLEKNTLLVVTADHGETLSLAHSGQSQLDRMPVRFHHAVGNFEETTRIPILLRLPGVLPEGKVVRDRISNLDLAPTLLELEGLSIPTKMTGKTLMPLVRGEAGSVPRTVISEGRGTRAIFHEDYRLLLREGGARFTSGYGRHGPLSEELFFLKDDPGERRNLAPTMRDKVEELRARLTAATAHVPLAGTETRPPEVVPKLRVRFAGGGQTHRVSATFVFGEDEADLRVHPVGISKDAWVKKKGTLEIALHTVRDAAVGFDVEVVPPTLPVKWKVYLDDRPLPEEEIFVGPFGFRADASKAGLVSDDARSEVLSPRLMYIDAETERGMFVTRDMGTAGLPATSGGEASGEMNKLLEEWGYAHKPKKSRE